MGLEYPDKGEYSFLKDLANSHDKDDRQPMDTV